jgi:hypothetical protein
MHAKLFDELGEDVELRLAQSVERQPRDDGITVVAQDFAKR